MYHLCHNAATRGNRAQAAAAAQGDKLKKRIAKLRESGDTQGIAVAMKRFKRLAPSDFLEYADRFESTPRVQEEIHLAQSTAEHRAKSTPEDVIATYKAIVDANIVDVLDCVKEHEEVVTNREGEQRTVRTYSLATADLKKLPLETQRAIQSVSMDGKTVRIKMESTLDANKQLDRYHDLASHRGATEHKHSLAAAVLGAGADSAEQQLADNENPRLSTTGLVPEEERLQHDWGELLEAQAQEVVSSPDEPDKKPEPSPTLFKQFEDLK